MGHPHVSPLLRMLACATRRCSVDVKTTRELRTSAAKDNERGWMSENYLFLQREEKCFLLTSPFIEPGGETVA